MAIEHFESIYWPLLAALQSRGIEVVIGGGMALYLRDLYVSPIGRSPDYPSRPASRTTKDMDAFITREVLSDPALFYQIPYVLKQELGFSALESNEYWQWGAVPDEAGYYAVMLDLLAAPPDDPAILVDSKDPRRLRPKPKKQAYIAHARRTPEAAGIDHAPRRLDLGDGRSLLIASSLNLIVLKLGALHDRLDALEHLRRTPAALAQLERESLLAQKHALDLLKIVSDMREEDWGAAQEQLALYGGEAYLQGASQQRAARFDSIASPGALALRDALRRDGLEEEWSGHLQRFVEDLRALLPAP